MKIPSDDVEILKWLQDQNYQTTTDEWGEHILYYDLDMPKILKDFIFWLNNEKNEKN